jgi:hypothetical protein
MICDEQNDGQLPDASTLAGLAAQAGVSPEQALKLWLGSQRLLKREEAARNRIKEARARQDSIPQPGQWPASLDDFYRIIVRAKDRTESQPRFKRYLRTSSENAESSFLGFKEVGFTARTVWNAHAAAYRTWWEQKKHAPRQGTGRVGAEKKAALRARRK